MAEALAQLLSEIAELENYNYHLMVAWCYFSRMVKHG